MNLLPANIPWYIVGPLFGLVVAGMYAVTNQPLGASGSYAQVTDRILGKPVKEPWRVPYMGGVIIGGFLATLVTGGHFAGWSYGRLGQLLPAGWLIVLLIGGGVLMGYGARWMGGCTSGHGLCGTAARSPGSFTATASFFLTAVTLILHAVRGRTMNRIGVLFGVTFGFVIALAKFTDYNVIHQGLLLHSARIYLIMASSMVVSTAVLWVLERRGWKTPIGGLLKLRRSPIAAKHIYGGVLFGIGWAVAGTCPAVSAAMVGSGRWMGIFVMVGLFLGTLLRDVVAGRYKPAPPAPVSRAPQAGLE